MRASIQQPIEAAGVTLIGVGLAYFFAPLPLCISHIEGYRVAVIENMILGAVFGALGYFCLRLAAQTWGRAMFRFSIREILLLTVIIALACGWAIDHAQYDQETSRLRSELMDRMTWKQAK